MALTRVGGAGRRSGATIAGGVGDFQGVGLAEAGAPGPAGGGRSGCALARIRGWPETREQTTDAVARQVDERLRG